MPTTILVLLVSLVLLAGCGSARRGEPLVGPIALSPAAAQGQGPFMRYCHECHPGGEAGLGPALNDKPLPGWLIEFQVRRGLGAMPEFSADRISTDELDGIVAYLQELRRGD